jgi:PhnB protein
MTRLNPYLNFNGNTKEAMEFYHSIFGGKLDMQTFGEANMAADESQKDLIVHARLESDGILIMASEGKPGEKVNFGDNVSLSLVGEDEEKLTEWFGKLSENGKITMPLAKQFWGDTFGMCTDKFGVQWMINILNPKK